MHKKDIDSLLNKGKHYVSQYITAYCYEQQSPSSQSTSNSSIDEQEKHLSEHDHRRLHQIIDHLFDFRQNITSEELIEWCKYLICGRRLPINFAKDVKQYDRTSKCALVWISNFVAYRCRTCAISLCMSLCADCFLNGNHEGHDFNMFRPEAGGACDCGDSFVMKPEGFCNKHRSNNDLIDNNKQPPNSLYCIANEMIPRLLHYLLLYLRGQNFHHNKKANALINDIFIYLCDLGTLMQTIICDTLIDPDRYKSCLKLNKNLDDDLDYQYYLKTLSKNYQKSMEELELTAIFKQLYQIIISSKLSTIIDDIESFNLKLSHESYLDEIIFWTIYYEFPTNLITFLLKMLPQDNYKQHFSKCFVKHYFRTSMLIMHPIERFMNYKDIRHNKLANAIVHISVQLFSNENLAKDLCDQYHLLYVIILSLKFAICGNGLDFNGVLKLNQDLSPNNNEIKHYVVCCDHSIFRYHRFWPLNSDLNNLFTHRKIAHLFLNDDYLIDEWLEFIMAFQAMNINLKSTKADDTNLNFKNSFPAEVEIASSQMWTLISQLNDDLDDTVLLTKKFIKHVIKWLRYWLESISFDYRLIDTDRCTFHLPLHRYYSVFVNHAILNQMSCFNELLPSNDDNLDELKNFMSHPLQTLIVSYHIMSNMWSGFGPNIKAQASNYMHPNFCNSKIDADLFLVQEIAAKMNPDEFVEWYFRLFGLNEHLNLTSLPGENEADKNRLIQFLENGFTLFAIIIAIHLNLGLSTNDITRKEMVALLTVSDKTHSQIQDMIPRRWGMLQNNNQFIDILHQIAEYKSPEVEVSSGSLVQGYFYPKSNIWQNEYDPLFVLYRNAQRREFQSSLERFATYAKQTGRYQSNSLPWPPFRIPSSLLNDRFIDPRIILHSKCLHAYFFSILYRSLNDSVVITQHLISIVIHLIELTLIESDNYDTDLCLQDFQKLDNRVIKSINEFQFSQWYPTADLLINFITIIRKTELSLDNNNDLKCNNNNDNGDQIKTKILASLFNLLIPDYNHQLSNPLEQFNNNNNAGPIISIDNNNNDNDDDDDDDDDDQTVNVIDLNQSSNNQSNNSITSMLSFYIDNDHLSDVLVREAKNLNRLISGNSGGGGNVEDSDDSNIDDDNSDDESQSDLDDQQQPEQQPSTSNKEKRLIIRTSKPIKFKLDLNESILTLLLRLHSKLSEKKDSFRTDPESLQKYDLELRIGDGPYFIGCLLKRFILLSTKRLQLKSLLPQDECFKIVINFIDNIRRSIWPTSTESTETVIDDCIDNRIDNDDDELANELKEKKRKALERKKQIMNKFCLLQNEFIKNNQTTFDQFDQDVSMDDNGNDSGNVNSNNIDNSQQQSSSSSSSTSTSSIKYQPKVYQCVICMDTGPSILERPFVQMVLLQSSSILNNTFAYKLSDEFFNNNNNDVDFITEKLDKFTTIPTTNDDLLIFKQRHMFSHYFEHKVDRLFSSFALDSWLSSFNIGYCGGILANSCGHFMHMDCYHIYITFVYQDRDSNDLIEYPCPLCRKVSNSVLPILPNLQNFPVVQSRNDNNDLNDIAVEILNLLSNCDQARLANTTQDDSKFLKVLAMSIEDVMKATEPQYRNIRVDPCTQSLFLFLSSISRTNLEYNVILWRKSLPLNQNASCLVPLFHALSLNAKLVLPMYYMKLWSQITGIVDSDDVSKQHVMPYEKQVPLLIKDVSAILLQFLYALPFNIDKAYFLSIVRSLLNVNFIQSLVMILFMFTMNEKQLIKNRYENRNRHQNEFDGFLDYIGYILSNFEINSGIIGIENRKTITKQLIIESIAKICLPFLRLSSMIYHLLFNQTSIPSINDLKILEEFEILANYLCLNLSSSTESTTTSESTINYDNETTISEIMDDTFFKPYINWMCNATTLINNWYCELDQLIQKNPIESTQLIQENCVITLQPKLLRLPKNYEQLFMFYHKRQCETCSNIPKDPSICLICGQLICIRETCCRNGNLSEGVYHSRKCGAGTALYLAINSSTIILIRGRKACAWGSVYLDEFGEEDRDLKRGKPLFLCEERYRILEQQWLTHSFLNINKKWIYHKDML